MIITSYEVIQMKKSISISSLCTQPRSAMRLGWILCTGCHFSIHRHINCSRSMTGLHVRTTQMGPSLICHGVLGKVCLKKHLVRRLSVIYNVVNIHVPFERIIELWKQLQICWNYRLETLDTPIMSHGTLTKDDTGEWS